MKSIKFSLLIICFCFTQCKMQPARTKCPTSLIKDTTLYFQSQFNITFDSIPGPNTDGIPYIDTVARINVLYKGLDSCYYIKNIKIGMRDKVWGFVNITSTNIRRIEPVCTNSGLVFFQTRKLTSNEIWTRLDSTRTMITGEVVNGKLKLEGIFYTDTALISDDSKTELLDIFSAEHHIDSAYIYYNR